MKNRVKYFLIFGIGLLLVGSIGMSYALFTTNTEKQGALNIVAGNVYCPLESSDLNDKYQVTVPAQHEKVIHITLRNASLIPVHSILVYIDNSNVKVYRELQSEDATELDKLDVNGTKDYRIVLKNTSNSDETVTFKGKCGLASKDLKLESTEKKIESDISIPNAPKLTDGLIAVKYDEGKKSWVKADTSNPLNNLWYDYDNQIWANAVTVEETGTVHNRDYYQKAAVGEAISMDDINTMWVWIPRYEYRYDNLGTQYAGGTQEQPGAIGINFIEGTKDSFSDQNSYKLHPAFIFGEEELEGFWYAKFETSSKEVCEAGGTANQGCDLPSLTPQIKPNVTSWRGIRVSTAFTVSRKMTTDDTLENEYGFSGDEDTHMSKNSEWGAVAYLSQSTYGKYGNLEYQGADKEVAINNCSSFITGIGGDSVSASESAITCSTNTYSTENGLSASTTGNIYGIYDMSGGANEYVMGVLADDSGNPISGEDVTYNSGFYGKLTDGSNYTSGIRFPDAKYYDLYTNTIKDLACSNNICYGHALTETENWYNDSLFFIEPSSSWMVRGGLYYDVSNVGSFRLFRTNGRGLSLFSFRIVLVP